LKVTSIAIDIRNIDDISAKYKVYKAKIQALIHNLCILIFKEKSKKCINMQVSGYGIDF